tara:strand:- start:2530 stop:2748 length:219 start_codon:yes stop_codon:yes gene_type:complete
MNKININKKVNKLFRKGKYENLVRLFAKKSKKESDLDTACFFATQAYILSLECNDPLSEELFIFLKKHNREY